MKITRDIITDLLPVYLAGEASANTEELIKEFLQDDPGFAKLIEENRAVLPEGQITLSKENEMETLNKTKSFLRKRSYYLAFAIFFTLFTASFKFGPNGLNWIWSDTPILGGIFLVIGIYFAILYWKSSQKLKGSDL